MSGSSCINNDWYCLFKMSALSLEALNTRPLSFNGAMPVVFEQGFYVIPEPRPSQ